MTRRGGGGHWSKGGSRSAPGDRTASRRGSRPWTGTWCRAWRPRCDSMFMSNEGMAFAFAVAPLRCQGVSAALPCSPLLLMSLVEMVVVSRIRLLPPTISLHPGPSASLCVHGSVKSCTRAFLADLVCSCNLVHLAGTRQVQETTRDAGSASVWCKDTGSLPVATDRGGRLVVNSTSLCGRAFAVRVDREYNTRPGFLLRQTGRASLKLMTVVDASGGCRNHMLTFED